MVALNQRLRPQFESGIDNSLGLQQGDQMSFAKKSPKM
jgi:hypothetical protein